MANLYKQNFRKRQLGDRVARGDFKKVPRTGAERNRLYRERKRRKREDAARPSSSADISDSDPPVDVDIDASSEELSVRELLEARWKTSTTRFKNMFTNNEFGLECNVCDRLWFDRDLTKASNKHVEILRSHFSDNLDTLKELQLFVTCKQSLNRSKLQTLSKINGFVYPLKPCGLPQLDPVSERLITTALIRSSKWLPTYR
jgi:hypothetical protein